MVKRYCVVVGRGTVGMIEKCYRLKSNARRFAKRRRKQGYKVRIVTRVIG